MAKNTNQGRAGIFRPWDGKLTGPQPGEPGPMPDRNQSWCSVQKKRGQTFTLEQVKQIVAAEVARAINAIKGGKPIPEFQPEMKEKEEQKEVVLAIGGK